MIQPQLTTTPRLDPPPARENMSWVPGGRYLMGSDYHYPEEAPAHAAIVEGFWIDHYAVTNERFARFVNATGYVTLAEIPPRPEDYPGAALRVYSVCATRRGLAKNAAEAAYASHSSKKSLAAQ